MKFAIQTTREVVTTETKTVTPETLTMAELFAIVDGRLAVGDLVSRDIANVLGVLKPAAFGTGTNRPPVTVIRAALFPQTRASKAASERLAWDFNDGTDIAPNSGEDVVTRKHLKAAARALGFTFEGTKVPYESKVKKA